MKQFSSQLKAFSKMIQPSFYDSPAITIPLKNLVRDYKENEVNLTKRIITDWLIDDYALPK